MEDHAKSPLVVLIVTLLVAGTDGTFVLTARYEWNTWDTWSSCHVDCSDRATFEQCRTRVCIDTRCNNQVVDKFQCGMFQDHVQFQGCPHTCPVDGGWGIWQAWSGCSQTCGDGSQTRQRSCDSPTPTQGGSQCAGNSTMSTQCHMTPCPIDGGWGGWAPWSSCDVTCGVGHVTRNRACSNPVPQHGGRVCLGKSRNTHVCNMSACRIDGGWFQWTNWTDCGVVCGDGHTVRTRTCLNPAPAGAGASCTGPSKERQSCNKGNCTNVTTICKDADLLQMTSGTPPITDPTQSPYTACHSRKAMQEMLLGKMCKVTSHAADWKLGTALVGDCGTVPLYSPLALVDKQTHDRTYAILLDCYNDAIQIIDLDCRMKVQVVPLDHTTMDYYMLLM